MKTYADKHFLTAKKNRESNCEAMPETVAHPTCLSKPRTFCGTDAHPDRFSSARTCLWVSLCLCFGKTALLLQANTPSGIAHLVQPAQETHPLPYVGPHQHARSHRRSPFSSRRHLAMLFCLPTLARLTLASLNADAILIHVSI